MSEVRANYALGKFDRILFVGLLPGTDLVNGLKQICSDTGIRYGVILTVVGSLLKLTIGQVVPDEKKSETGCWFYGTPSCVWSHTSRSGSRDYLRERIG